LDTFSITWQSFATIGLDSSEVSRQKKKKREKDISSKT